MGRLENTHSGFIDPKVRDQDGCFHKVGYYRTLHGKHRYIEDYYANLLKNVNS